MNAEVKTSCFNFRVHRSAFIICLRACVGESFGRGRMGNVDSAQSVFARRLLHQFDEAAEVVCGVVGAGRGFGVVLDGEDR